MVVLDPVPAYVIKSLNIAKNEKVFINVCTDTQIDAPDLLDPSEIAMQVTQGRDWTIPIVVSTGRRDVDKKGNPSFVVDCCMNPKVVLLGIEDPSVKILTVETCIELVEDRYHITLDRDYKFPRMKVKNQLIKTEFNPEQPKELSRPSESLNPLEVEAETLLKPTEPVESKKIAEIEVLDSKETMFYLHIYRGPYSGSDSRPSHVVEVEGEHRNIQLIGNQMILDNHRQELPFTPRKYQAFMSSDTTNIMLWKP